MFITFEGLEGSGKSTQASILANRLKEKGFPIVATREPGGTRIGEEIRNITHSRESVDLTAVAETYLMAASRAQHVREIIKPALDAKKTVICDRYIDSSLAYQGYGRMLGLSTIEQLNHLAINKCLPDITFFLDVPILTGFKRRNSSDKIDRMDLQQKAFYERVYAGYLEIQKIYPKRIISINAARTIETVAEEIEKIIRARINLG